MEKDPFYEINASCFYLNKGEIGDLYVSIIDEDGICNSKGQSFNISLRDFYKISASEVIDSLEVYLADALKTPSETGDESGSHDTHALSIAELTAKIDGLATKIESLGDGLGDLTTDLAAEIGDLDEITAKLAAGIPSAGESERHTRLSRQMKVRFAADAKRSAEAKRAQA